MKREVIVYGDKFPDDFAVCGGVLFIGYGHTVAKIVRRLGTRDPKATSLVLRDKVTNQFGENVTPQWQEKLAKVNEALAKLGN